MVSQVPVTPPEKHRYVRKKTIWVITVEARVSVVKVFHLLKKSSRDTRCFIFWLSSLNCGELKARNVLDISEPGYGTLCSSTDLVSIPDIVADLPHPFLSPVRSVFRIAIDHRVRAKPALTRQLHARSIGPCFPWLPGGTGNARETIPSPVRAHFERYKAFSQTIMWFAMFLYQCAVSQFPVIVDLSQEAQTLACKPDRPIVELINHFVVIVMSVSAMVLIPPLPIPGLVGFIIAQRLVFVKVGTPNGRTESVCPFHDITSSDLTKLGSTVRNVSSFCSGTILRNPRLCVE